MRFSDSEDASASARFNSEEALWWMLHRSILVACYVGDGILSTHLRVRRARRRRQKARTVR